MPATKTVQKLFGRFWTGVGLAGAGWSDCLDCDTVQGLAWTPCQLQQPCMGSGTSMTASVALCWGTCGHNYYYFWFCICETGNVHEHHFEGLHGVGNAVETGAWLPELPGGRCSWGWVQGSPCIPAEWHKPLPCRSQGSKNGVSWCPVWEPLPCNKNKYLQSVRRHNY